MGKSGILGLSAFLMLLWYLACTAGFSLHTCLHSGDTSVIAFAGVQYCAHTHVSCGCCSHCCTHEAGPRTSACFTVSSVSEYMLIFRTSGIMDSICCMTGA